jgi:hypothetical protein
LARESGFVERRPSLEVWCWQRFDSDPPTFAAPTASYNWQASEGRAPKFQL